MSDLKEIWIFSTYFRKKNWNIRLHENPSSWSGIVSYGQTDRHTDMIKLIVTLFFAFLRTVRFLQNVPKNLKFLGTFCKNRIFYDAIYNPINLLAPELLFLILAHPVYKMWIIQEPNTLELWKKLHFEEKKNVEYISCLKYVVPIFVE